MILNWSIYVLERFQVVDENGKPKNLGRWVGVGISGATIEQISEDILYLRGKHGAAKAVSGDYEVIALRNSYGVKKPL